MQALTLFELNSIVHQAFSKYLPDEYWVQAELSEVRVNPAGHCYVEFIQKDGGKISTLKYVDTDLLLLLNCI